MGPCILCGLHNKPGGRCYFVFIPVFLEIHIHVHVLKYTQNQKDHTSEKKKVQISSKFSSTQTVF